MKLPVNPRRIQMMSKRREKKRVNTEGELVKIESSFEDRT